jgi:hypothetical protein
MNYSEVRCEPLQHVVSGFDATWAIDAEAVFFSSECKLKSQTGDVIETAFG